MPLANGKWESLTQMGVCKVDALEELFITKVPILESRLKPELAAVAHLDIGGKTVSTVLAELNSVKTALSITFSVHT
jgi:hypothetical protein